MEVRVITGQSENTELLTKMYRLRAKIFSKRLGWSVNADHGIERDEFDTFKARYILVTSDKQVVGCARFLDFSQSTMVASHFSDLLDSSAPICTRAAVESSRFCIDTEALRSKSGDASGRKATGLLISAMIEWAALHRYKAIVTVTDVGIERLLRRLNVPFERLGRPRRIEQTMAVVGQVDIAAAQAHPIKAAALDARAIGSVSASA